MMAIAAAKSIRATDTAVTYSLGHIEEPQAVRQTPIELILTITEVPRRNRLGNC